MEYFNTICFIIFKIYSVFIFKQDFTTNAFIKPIVTLNKIDQV